MHDLVFQSGYAGLFIVSFLAATLVPLGSEAFVVSMTILGYNPWLVFTTAATGNTLGAVINYYAGRYGTNAIFYRYIRVDPVKRRHLERRFRKWGSPVLFFAWLPLVGDPLTVVAGGLNLNLYIFLFWVAFGKAFRYALLIMTAGTF